MSVKDLLTLKAEITQQLSTDNINTWVLTALKNKSYYLYIRLFECIK